MLTFDLNNFGPCHPDVWGTFSDWVMVIVTSITAFYLYRTLVSQQQLNKIEQMRYIESIKPIFEVQIQHLDISSTKGSYRIDTSFIFKNIGGNARDVSIDITSKDDPRWKFYQTDNELILPIKAETVIAGIVNARYNSDKPVAGCTFLFEFKDIIGNIYKQFMVCSFINDDYNVTNSIPHSHGGGKLHF